MLTTLALAALTLAPAQGGELKIANVRLTVGELGPPRASARFLPGDILFVGFDITGLSIEDNGIGRYRMSVEVTDSAGKSVLKPPGRELEEPYPLRGNMIPARVYLNIGLDHEPGVFTCKITVEDPKTKAKDTLTTKFEVLKRDFGIVAVYASHDIEGRLSAPTTGMVGQTTYIQLQVASFQRDPKTKQPRVHFEFQVLDEKGTPILGKPGQYIQDEKSFPPVDENDARFRVLYKVFMSRPGKFTVRVTATDKITEKKSVYELPLTVLPGN
ncbi:MAG TPA: hypothetical protein VM529_13135 [Gemmata sp.]|nr:hypothetical protein [Gemmata sp.]